MAKRRPRSKDPFEHLREVAAEYEKNLSDEEKARNEQRIADLKEQLLSVRSTSDLLHTLPPVPSLSWIEQICDLGQLGEDVRAIRAACDLGAEDGSVNAADQDGASEEEDAAADDSIQGYLGEVLAGEFLTRNGETIKLSELQAKLVKQMVFAREPGIYARQLLPEVYDDLGGDATINTLAQLQRACNKKLVAVGLSIATRYNGEHGRWGLVDCSDEGRNRQDSSVGKS